MESLIAIKQLPILEECAHAAQKEVEERIFVASSMVCTEDTVKAVKANRSENRKLLDSIKMQIRDVEDALLAPFSPIKEFCKNELIAPLEALDERQKQDISDVEDGIIKARCEADLRRYFDELCAVHHLDWLTYERAGIKVDMASAKAGTPKKLRERLAAWVEHVSQQVDAIQKMEYSDKILYEYKLSLNFASAIDIVHDRHRRIEEQKTAQESRKAEQAREAEMVRRVEALAPPVVVETPEPVVKCTFTVHTTKGQLRKLKEFLIMEGIQYE